MTDTDIERRLADMRRAEMPSGNLRRPTDTARAWRDFQELRSRSAAIRRRTVTATVVAAIAAAAIAVPALTGSRPAGKMPEQPRVSASLPGAPRTYPGAVVARIQMSGVTAVVGDAGHAWVVRAIEPGIPTTYQLAGIDLRTNAIMFHVNLGRQQPAIAAGDGRLWLTTPFGQARGQIIRVDLATGRILSIIHLAAGRCAFLVFSSGHLFANCVVSDPAETEFWRISPVTQQAYRLAGPVHGYISSVVAAPRALWYVVNYMRISGLWNAGGNPLPVTARDPGYQDLSAGEADLAYDAGSIWALGPSEKLARIDAVTGRVVRFYTYRNYDPRRAGGLNFLTAGGGWLWFLDNGYPFSGVLRVSESTGRASGGVSIPANSCGQVTCSQIYCTPGSVWVPTAELLIRIDPARLPG